MLSSAMIAAIQMQTMDDSFLDKIRVAGQEDDNWMARKGELHRLKEKREALPKHWELEDGLHYYKGRLFVPSKEELLTENRERMPRLKGSRTLRTRKND